jgi:hypothetical protein
MPVIPASQKTEIMGLRLRPVWSISSEDSISVDKLGMVVCAYHPSYAGRKNRRMETTLVLGKNLRPYPEKKKN